MPGHRRRAARQVRAPRGGDALDRPARHRRRQGAAVARGDLGPAGRARSRPVLPARVPARGPGDRGFRRAGQDRDRRQRSRQRRRAWPASTRVIGGAGGDRLRHRRAGQIRRQRLACAQGRLRQRDRQRGAGAGGRQPRADVDLPARPQAQSVGRLSRSPAWRSAAPACPRTCARCARSAAAWISSCRSSMPCCRATSATSSACWRGSPATR